MLEKKCLQVPLPTESVTSDWELAKKSPTLLYVHTFGISKQVIRILSPAWHKQESAETKSVIPLH